ncbi:hypothetical protein ZYGM_003328 [Zygosaccharomyces mellis]|uniref:Sister chromatid cohesion protein DCC1 n=1 Tax=Zygosaccharomyces mellis TaxID=42258 RepID=A0A4C2E5Q6_9SACH|nr:hypothetical protein ZYGM_003328 [Zygosaccharomyces mellis]
MSLNLHERLSIDRSFRLLHLTPELLEVLKDPNSKLQFKAAGNDEDDGDVVLCSREKTWLLRQKNHSNTTMLMHEFTSEQETPLETTFGLPSPMSDFAGFARTTFEYETKEVSGILNVESIPIHNGSSDFPPADGRDLPVKSMDDLLASSACSEKECLLQWGQLGGCVIKGYPCILSSDFLTKALHVTLMSAMAESLNFSRLRLGETFDAVNKDIDQESNPYTIDVIKTILEKYGEKVKDDDDCWQLNQKKVAVWYGIRALKKYASQSSIPPAEFLIKWKSTFPPYAPFDIEIEMLRGWFFRPTGSSLQYLPKNTLPSDIKERFMMLFKLQSQWDMDDIVPFVEELNSKGLKIDVFLMKYARKRRVGKKVIISSR